MKKNKVFITSELESDLKKYLSNVCSGMAATVRDDLTEQTAFAIGFFYMDYKPEYYKRHYYNLMDNSYRKYYKNPHSQLARGGVELSSTGMDSIYRADKDYIFNLVYLGYHGNVPMLPPVEGKGIQGRYAPPNMNPSPLEIILNRRDYIVSNINKFTIKAFDRANKDKYNTLN